MIKPTVYEISKLRQCSGWVNDAILAVEHYEKWPCPMSLDEAHREMECAYGGMIDAADLDDFRVGLIHHAAVMAVAARLHFADRSTGLASRFLISARNELLSYINPPRKVF